MWRLAHQMKLHGGPGIDCRRPRPPTERAEALGVLRRRLKRLGLPSWYAERLARLQLKPRAMGQVLAELVELRKRIEAAEAGLARLRQEVRGLLESGAVELTPERLLNL